MPAFLKAMAKTVQPAACALAAALIAAGPRPAAGQSAALNLARQLNQAFVEVASNVSPSVVVIDIKQRVSIRETDGGDGSFWDILPPDLRRRFQKHGAIPHTPDRYLEGEGSGIIISDDGYILTNSHVVENSDEILVRLKDGRTFDGEVKGADPESDIAIVKIKATGLLPAKLGNSDAAQVGEFVLAIGAPFELSDTVTVGHISAKERFFREMGAFADQDFIQTDAKILPGNSGGPLVNLCGEVIGINTMIEGLDSGVGFAVPINLAKRVKDHLITEGKFTRSWLGIGIDNLTDNRDYLALGGKLAPDARDGVIVAEIMFDGPAAKSGLRPGDVITAVDGKNVKSMRQLRDEVAGKKSGRPALLDVVRAKQHLSIQIVPGVMPGQPELASTARRSRGAAPAGAANLGLTVQTITKDLAGRFDVEVTPGVIVTAVQQDSPSAQQRIRPGDIITEINRQPVSTPRQFRDALQAADAKGGVMIILVGQGASRFVVLKDNGDN